MKVLLGPANFGNQPAILNGELKRQGVDSNLLVYSPSKADLLNSDNQDLIDWRVNLRGTHRTTRQMEVLRQSLEKNFDIYHFWFRSLVYSAHYKPFIGLDLPVLKAFQKPIMFRFTGSDLRSKKVDMELNKYSAYHYGLDLGINELDRQAYIAFLKCFVDEFVVQDPEMKQFFPEAKVIERAFDITGWDFVGPRRTRRPLIVHAPTQQKIKGTKFICDAVDLLAKKGRDFEFKLVENMPRSEARKLYEAADIVVDQLHIGAYGILALECMALGKPVIVYVREDLFQDTYGDIPIINANPENIAERLDFAISNKSYREELGIKAREFVIKFHNIENVASKLIERYDELKFSRPKKALKPEAIKYIEGQYGVNDRNTRSAVRKSIATK